MGPVRRSVVGLLVGWLVLATVAGSAVAAVGPVESDGGAVAAVGSVESDAGAVAAAQQAAVDLDVEQEFRLLPSTPGVVEVVLHFDLSDDVEAVSTEVPADANVTSIAGFELAENRTYRWRGHMSTPGITYRLPVNETVDGSDDEPSPEGASGDLVGVDTGEWALFRRPPTGLEYEIRDGGYAITPTTADPGAAGDSLIYLGEHEVYERTAHGQTFELVVPEAATMGPDPETVLDTMTDASDALRVRDRDEEVFVVAAPTGDVPWGVRGAQVGDADLWVRDREPVDDPENVWVHEYVHTRQDLRVEPELRWFREASASYYAALLTFEQERISFEAFRDRLAEGERPVYEETVLINDSTWVESPHYHKGALALGQIDRMLRLETDSEHTLQTVFGDLNGQAEVKEYVDFLGSLDRVVDPRAWDDVLDYVGSRSAITTWNETAHVRAFGQLPARVGYQLPPPDADGAYRVAGPYRESPLDSGEPLVMVTGERLLVNATVSNAGGTTGEYEVPLLVDGVPRDGRNGTVGAGNTTNVTLGHTFSTVGRHQVSVDGDNITVEVHEPAVADVVDVTAERLAARQGESVTVTVHVRNDADLPGRALVVVSRNYEPVAVEAIPVAPGGEGERAVDVHLPSPGTTIVTAGSYRPIEITVRPRPVHDSVAPDVVIGPDSIADEDPAASAPAKPGDGGTGPSLATALGLEFPVALHPLLVTLWLAYVGRRR